MAKYYEPSVIFFDEVDSVAGQRTSSDSEYRTTMKNELLKGINDINESKERVSILAATNRPQALDTAFLRRMGRILYVGLPEENDRKLIL
jgi:SpoVK/Ycf46/Vps4 family AAA+-type ATPase